MKTFSYTAHSKQVLGDMHTPVSIYLKVRDMYPQSALMESSDYHAGENSLSFIALCPLASIGVNSGIVTASYPDNSRKEEPLTQSFTVEKAMNQFISQFQVTGENKNVCGLYGYTTFNAVKYFEHIPVKESHDEQNDAPDVLYILYKYIIVFNHFKNELTLVEMLGEGEESGLPELEAAIENRNYASYNFSVTGPVSSSISDEEHKANVRKGIAHCMRGDVFQIVLSRRFVQPYAGDDFKVYRALRSINPSPYLFYFDFGGYRIFGSSPETHCKIEDGRAYIDPIAGTTRRTGDTVKDRELAEALLADPKENAEHVMLVDLARNDLSRNCHDVRVLFYKEPQYYSHVIHLVSRVSGQLNEGADKIKTFIDTFPAGTLSGAPKVRAMQLISEIEPHNRGAYGGCIGFIGLNGELNQAITIRTFVSRNNELWFQAGGGIVARSQDEYELQEVNNKLGALKKAIDLAVNLKKLTVQSDLPDKSETVFEQQFYNNNKMKILLLDNYDSFTYNLLHAVKELGATDVEVVRNDQINLDEVERFDKIILSPGPGIPEEAGLLLPIIKRYAPTKSILGVCLGHQAIGEAFGARLENLKEVYHGVQTPISILQKDVLFEGLGKEIPVGRYHSWVVSREGFPECLEITAESQEGQIMALRHKTYDVHGIQFHPESVLTPQGKEIIKNFLNE